MAVSDAHVFPGFLTPVLTQIYFQSHRLLFLHASAEVRGENTPERKFASTGSYFKGIAKASTYIHAYPREFFINIFLNATDCVRKLSTLKK